MANRLYYDPRINIENVATDLEHTFLSQGYQVQHFGDSDHMTVQMRKGGDLATIIGMQTALTVTMQRSPRGILTMIGHQKWVDKAVVGAVGIVASPILWPLIVTAGIGAFQQANLGNQVSNALDMSIRKQNPEVQFGPIPPEMMPQYEQSGAPHTSPQPQKILCPNCGAETKADATFCTKCGTPLTQKEELSES